MSEPAFQVTRKRKDRSSRNSGRKYHKKSGVFATPAGMSISGSGGARSSVIKAAMIFRDAARMRAAKFSRRIPPATNVVGLEEQQAMIVTDGQAAPNAAPFEFGERHPDNLPNLTGNGTHRSYKWSKQPTRAYMSNAAKSSAVNNQALQAYSDEEYKLLCEEYGYDK